MKKLLFILLVSLFVCGITFGQKSKDLSISIKPLASEKFRLERVESFSDETSVWIGWQTVNESEILGYNVYRINENGSVKKKQVNSSIIAGSALSSNGVLTEKDYSFIDSEGTLNSIYIIESIDTKGNKFQSDYVYPRFTNDLSSFKGQELGASSSVINEKIIAPPEAIDTPRRNGVSTAEETQRWVAAQPGVKIAVKADGFYRISRAALQSAGFNTASTDTNWQLYADGIEQPMLVDANNIEFLGRGIDTISSDKRIYYLVSGTTVGKRIQPTLRRQIRGTVLGRYFDSSIEVKDKITYASGILNGDTDNFLGKTVVGSAATPTPTSMTVSLPNVNTELPKAQIQVGVQPLTAGFHNIKVLVNGEDVGNITGFDKIAIYASLGVPSSVLLNGNNTVQFVAQGGSSDISCVLFAKINYQRNYVAAQNQLSFYTQHYQTTKIEGFSSPNVRVFDTSNIDNPLLITNAAVAQNGANYNVTLLANRTRTMFAVSDNGLLSPDSITANTPSTLSASSRNADMIIISHNNFMAQANTWATYRRGQGLTVEVVNVEDIYDEFNFGYAVPESIRNFLQFTTTNWQNVRYALLIGDATYDYRNYKNNAFANYIPTKLVDTVYLETGSDEALADFNNDGLSEIAIGRLPVRDTQSLTNIFNKITNFETTVSTALVNRGSLFVSDEPNGYDFQGVNQRIAAELPANVQKFFTYKPDANSRITTLNHLNQGMFVVNWSGHGNTSVWSANNFVNKVDMGQLTNSNYTIFTLLTCLNGYYVEPTADDVFGEVALKNPNGSSIAVWASSGLTTPDVQEVMARRFYSKLGSDPAMTRIGDAIIESKAQIPFGRDVRLSWSLLGDPTMKIK